MKSTDAISLMIQEYGRQARNEPRFLLMEDGIDAIQYKTDKIMFGHHLDKDVLKEAAVSIAATAFRLLVDCCE